MFKRVIDKVKSFFVEIPSFFSDHGRDFLEFCLGLFLGIGLSVVVFMFPSCRGVWTFDNETKVNGVGVSTHIEYSEKSGDDSTVESEVEIVDDVPDSDLKGND